MKKFQIQMIFDAVTWIGHGAKCFGWTRIEIQFESQFRIEFQIR